MEIRRFGVGHRRPDGPPGTTGVTGQLVNDGAAGTVAELAFARRAHIEPHSNPNDTWFVVIEGGGWVQVGDERARVAAGEAVHWPANVVHGAWTELSEMRVIVVEFPLDAGPARLLLEGRATDVSAEGEGDSSTGAPGEDVEPGRASRGRPPAPVRGVTEGEPW